MIRRADFEKMLGPLSLDETAELGAECINQLPHDKLRDLFEKVDGDQAVECHGVLTALLDDMDGDEP